MEQLAQRQLSDYDLHRPGTLFAGYPVPMTIDDAYQLQLAVAALREQRGEPVAGYKIGCVSAVMQAQLGLDRPVFGHIFETEIHRSGVTLDSAQYEGLAIEGELAVRLAADIPNADWLSHHAAEAISSAFAVIELHNYVFRNTPHNAQELIGNNAIHAGVVAPLSEPRSAHLDASIQVAINGTILGAAALSDGPFASILLLAEHLARIGRTLRQGQIVLTGSPLPLYRVGAGDRIDVSCNRSETVTAQIRPKK